MSALSVTEVSRGAVPGPRGEHGSFSDVAAAEGPAVHVTRPPCGVLVVAAVGMVDSTGAECLAQAVRTQLSCSVHAVIVDVSGVSVFSTHGAVTLLEARQRAVMRQATMVVITQNRRVDRLLSTLELAGKFTYGTSVAAAVEAAAAGSAESVAVEGGRA